jgi:hypothetical protein
MNTLSSLDLEQMIRQYGLQDDFNGIYSKDLLPSTLVKGWYIINLENHDEGNGTHWTCFKITNNKINIYFDSFNFVAPKIVDEKIKPYIYNDKQIQDVTSSACGWYCIACINYVEKHNVIAGDILAFKDFVNGFSKNQDYNDGILQRYL